MIWFEFIFVFLLGYRSRIVQKYSSRFITEFFSILQWTKHFSFAPQVCAKSSARQQLHWTSFNEEMYAMYRVVQDDHETKYTQLCVHDKSSDTRASRNELIRPQILPFTVINFNRASDLRVHTHTCRTPIRAAKNAILESLHSRTHTHQNNLQYQVIYKVNDIENAIKKIRWNTIKTHRCNTSYRLRTRTQQTENRLNANEKIPRTGKKWGKRRKPHQEPGAQKQ